MSREVLFEKRKYFYLTFYAIDTISSFFPLEVEKLSLIRLRSTV